MPTPKEPQEDTRRKDQQREQVERELPGTKPRPEEKPQPHHREAGVDESC